MFVLYLRMAVLTATNGKEPYARILLREAQFCSSWSFLYSTVIRDLIGMWGRGCPLYTNKWEPIYRKVDLEANKMLNEPQVRLIMKPQSAPSLTALAP